jgi:hypothetical protein
MRSGISWLHRERRPPTIRRALWIDGLTDYEPLATAVAAEPNDEGVQNSVTTDSVGRPGLDPGTLGLKVGSLSSFRSGHVHLGSSGWVWNLTSSPQYGPIHEVQ